MARNVNEQALMRKYDDFFDKMCEDSNKALMALVQDELEKERADSPVKKKRQIMYEMYPHLKKLCLGDVKVLFTALDNPYELYDMK